MNAMRALGSLSFRRVESPVIAHMDAPDHQRLAFQLNLAGSLRDETAFAGGDVARLQRCPRRRSVNRQRQPRPDSG